MRRWCRATCAALATLALAAWSEPPAFLSAIEGAPAMAWVRAQNRRSLAILRGDPHFAVFQRQALALAQTRDRIPAPELIGGAVYNFWQDPTHVRGIWRRASLASYRTASPAWRTVIDLDRLARDEHVSWVWKGVNCAAPAERLCLVALSDGGEDAAVYGAPAARPVQEDRSQEVA